MDIEVTDGKTPKNQVKKYGEGKSKKEHNPGEEHVFWEPESPP